MVDPNHCAIEERVNGEFKSSYTVHNCAKKYAEVLEHTPYTAFGLNWNVLIPEEHPSRWLKNRFLRHEGWPDTMGPTALHISHSQDSAFYNFTLGTQQSTENENYIALQCNIHFDVQNAPQKVKKISNVVQNLEKYQSSLQELLNRYLIGNTP